MKNSAKTLIASAALLGTAAMAPASVAMDKELSMLEAAVTNQLTTLGVDAEKVDTLTVGELALLKTVFESEDTTASKSRRAKEILDISTERSTIWGFTTEIDGTSSLKDDVVSGLSTLDVEVANPDDLSVAQLAQLKAVLNSDATTASKSRRAEAIIEN